MTRWPGFTAKAKPHEFKAQTDLFRIEAILNLRNESENI
jgi:hypothetical protein